MSDNIIPLNNVTYLDIPADRILEEAKGKMDTVILIGFDVDGAEYFASSVADGGEVLWMLERCKIGDAGLSYSHHTE